MRQVSAGGDDAPSGSTSRPSIRIVGDPGNERRAASSSVVTSRTSTGWSTPCAASTSSRSCCASGYDGHSRQNRSSIFIPLGQRGPRPFSSPRAAELWLENPPALEVPEGIPQGAALAVVARERLRQPPLALGGEAEVRDPAVGGRALALHEPALLGAAHQLRDRALRELEPLGQLRHRRLLAVVGGALDHQQQQVPLRRQPGPARVPLAGAQKLPQRGAKLRHPRDLLRAELVHTPLLIPGRTNPMPSEPRHEPRREGLDERRYAVPARDEELAAVAVHRADDLLRHALRPDHQRPPGAAPEAA